MARRRALLLMIMTGLIASVKSSASKSYSGITWLSKPGNFSSLENTDTIFNWTHTRSPHPINIAWVYWGPVGGNKSLQYILEYDINVLKRIHPRVEYDEFPGSAVMILRNATSADDGVYQVRVADIDPKTIKNTPFISDKIFFSVIVESALRYTVTIAGHTHHLSVSGNGTNVTLPDILILPHVLDFGVEVNTSAPEPAHISLEYQFGTNGKRYLCDQAYTCHTGVTLAGAENENRQINIKFIIEFEIQNLDHIVLTTAVGLDIREVATHGWIGWIFLIAQLFVGVIAAGVTLRGKLKDRCSPKSFPLLPCNGESKPDLHKAKDLRHRTLHYGQASKPGTTEYTPYDINSLGHDPKFITYSTSLKEKYLLPFDDIHEPSVAEYFYRISVDTTVDPKGSLYMCHIRMIVNGLQNSCGGKVAITCRKYAWGRNRWRNYIKSSLTPNVESIPVAEFIRGDQPLIACLNVRRKTSVFTYQKAENEDKFVMYFLLCDDGNIDSIGGLAKESVLESTTPTPQPTPSNGSIPEPMTTAHATTPADYEAPTNERTDEKLPFGPHCSRSFAKSKSGFETKLDLEEVDFEMLNTFREAQPVRFTPSKIELKNYPQLRTAIFDIEKLSHLECFAVILENDFACSLMEDSTGAREGHLADVIHVDTGPKISIIALYDPNKGGCGIERKNRTFVLARLVMKKLIEETLSEKQIYVHPLTHSGGKMQGDRERKWLCLVDLGDIKRCLGNLLLQDKTGFKDRINSAITFRLTEQQIEPILGMGLRKFCVIQGAPGTGKTLLEQIFCERNGKDQCAILCQSTGVRAFINYEGKAEAYLTPKDVEETVDLLRGSLGKHKYIIIDDAQYIPWRSDSWQLLFKAIKSSSQHLYIFMDSKYQTYKGEDTAKIIGTLLGAELEANLPMMKIHRNSEVVFEYMKTLAPKKGDWENLKCVCRIPGDDAKLSRVPDMHDVSGQNGLLTFVKSLGYSYKDIAILFDAGNTKSGHVKIRDLFQHNLPKSRAQACDKFPVEGIVIDSVDNFLGLDAPCVIMVLGQSSNLKNSRYLLTIASRAVQRLEFVKFNFNDEETELLKFEEAPIEKREELAVTNEVALNQLAEDSPQMHGDRRSLHHKETTDRHPQGDSVTIEMDETSPLLQFREDQLETGPSHQSAQPQEDSEVDGAEVNLLYLFDVSCEPNSAMELPSGQILVTDFHHGQIYLLTKDLQLVKSFDNGSRTPSAAGIVRDSVGNIYVAEQVNDTITVYDSQYNLSRQITNDTIQDGNYMTGPLGMVLTKHKLLYFCDSRNHRIQVRQLDGTFVATFGQRGKGPGDFKHHPCFIAVSNHGLVAVTDRGGKLYLFTPQGGHKYKHKPFTVDPSTYIKQARGVIFHPTGNIILADTAGKLVVLTVDGEPVSTIGEPGAGLGQLQWPRDLCVTTKGDILVCEKENHRVQLFRRPLP